MNIIQAADLQTVEVQETAVRNNPALRVTFPKITGLRAHFVADPGDDYWLPQIIFTLEQDSDQMLQDYIDGGQGSYGSDAVIRNADGDLIFDGVVEKGLTREVMERDVADQIRAEADGDDDNPNFFLITAQATSVSQEILEAVAATEAGRTFFDKHVDRHAS